MMKRQKLYFSNHISEDWTTDNQQMRMVLIPKRWWIISDWFLAKSFNKGFHIIGMTEIKVE